MRGGQAAFHVLAGLVARVDGARGLQQLPDIAEPGEAVRLNVRRMRAADIGAFGPLQAEPAKVFDRRVGELRTASPRVQVFGSIEYVC